MASRVNNTERGTNNIEITEPPNCSTNNGLDLDERELDTFTTVRTARVKAEADCLGI